MSYLEKVATIELASFESIDILELTTPPDWYSNEPIWEAAYDFGACLAHNAGPFAHDDVKQVRTITVGEHDGADWEWLVALHDGRRFYAIGGCDYTGWDCQSGAQYTEIPATSYAP